MRLAFDVLRTRPLLATWFDLLLKPSRDHRSGARRRAAPLVSTSLLTIETNRKVE